MVLGHRDVQFLFIFASIYSCVPKTLSISSIRSSPTVRHNAWTQQGLAPGEALSYVLRVVVRVKPYWPFFCVLLSQA